MSEGLRILSQAGILSIFIFLVNMASLVQPVEVRLKQGFEVVSCRV